MALLPSQFSDLEPFAERWSLQTETERWDERLSSTMDELQAFYDAALPRMEEAIAHLDTLPLDDMPTDEVRLLWLIYSFVLVSFAAELWRRPEVPDCGATAFVRILEPLP